MIYSPKTARLFIGTLLIFIIYNTSLVYAQKFFPIKVGGIWGAIDIEGKTTISPTYSFIGDFGKDDIAVASNNNLSGFINGNGKIVIPLNYKKVRRIKEKFISVCNDEGCALANLDGKIISPFDYQVLIHFNDHLIKTYNHNKFGLINYKGEVITTTKHSNIFAYPEKKGLIQLQINTKNGLIDEVGNEILPVNYETIIYNNGHIEAKNNKSYTIVWLDDKNKVMETKDFPNEMAKNLDLKAREKKEKLSILKSNPDAKKPRWSYESFRYTLVNGVGQNLLGGKEFFDVGIDKKLEKSLAREVVQPQEKGGREKILSYLVDQNNAKIIFTANVKDMVISDFNVASYARATVDTLWDALIDFQGNTIEEIEGKPIANIGDFTNGLAWIKSGTQYGFINTEGKLVIPLEFQIVSDFSSDSKNGYAVARKNGLFGCIDSKGNAIVPFEYDGIDLPKNGIVRVKKGKGREGRWGAINLQQKEIIPFNYSLIYPFKNGIARMRQGRNWGLIRDNGKVVIPPSIYCDFLDEFKEGIAMVGMERWVEETPSGPIVRYKKQGYIKKDGSYLIDPIYDKIEGFEAIWTKQEGLARIYKNGKVGYVNYKGIVELEAIYEETFRFDTVWKNNSGISPVKKEGLFGYLDHNGNEILPCVYQEISKDFMKVGTDSVGVAMVKKEGKYGFVNFEGKEVILPQYDLAIKEQNGVIPVKSKGLWGAIDTLNNKLISLDYDGVRFFEGSQGQLLELLKKEDSYYELNRNGKFMKEVSEMPKESISDSYTKLDKYVYKTDFDKNGLAVVEKKGKLALVNAQGVLLTKYKYKEIEPFSDGLALVRVDAKERKDQLYGYINFQGAEAIAPTYKLAKSFSGGHAAILKRANWGFINKEGKIIIDPKFKEPGKFSGGYAIINSNEIYDKNGNLTGKFSLEGKISDGFNNERAIVKSTSGAYHITPKGMPAYFAKYDEVTPFYGQVAFVKRGEIWELSRKTGENVTKIKLSRANKNSYLAAYGERRKEKLPDGRVLEDLGWKLVSKGTWKMIDTDGNFLSSVVIKELTTNQSGNYVINIENKLGLANLNGEIMADCKFEVIRTVSDRVIRLESAGEIGYLSIDGKWLQKID